METGNFRRVCPINGRRFRSVNDGIPDIAPRAASIRKRNATAGVFRFFLRVDGNARDGVQEEPRTVCFPIEIVYRRSSGVRRHK